MKKIGLTLSDEIYNMIVEIAQANNKTPTTICSLIIQTRVEFYNEKNYFPIFGQKYFEEIHPSRTPEEMEELTRIAKTKWLEDEQ